jgi:hypothetical protein
MVSFGEILFMTVGMQDSGILWERDHPFTALRTGLVACQDGAGKMPALPEAPQCILASSATNYDHFLV